MCHLDDLTGAVTPRFSHRVAQGDDNSCLRFLRHWVRRSLMTIVFLVPMEMFPFGAFRFWHSKMDELANGKSERYRQSGPKGQDQHSLRFHWAPPCAPESSLETRSAGYRFLDGWNLEPSHCVKQKDRATPAAFRSGATMREEPRPSSAATLLNSAGEMRRSRWALQGRAASCRANCSYSLKKRYRTMM